MVRTKSLVAVMLAMICLSACQRPVADANRTQSSEAQQSRPMRIVTDGLERRITVPTRVERVVSTAPNVTEMIFAVGAGDRLVGVTTFCDYPEEAKSIAKVGDTMNPNMETIIALKPDIVFVSTASQIEAFMRTLEQNGISVYVLNPTSINDVLQDLEQSGIIFGTEEKAEKVTTELRESVRSIERRLDVRRYTDEEPGEYHRRSGSVNVFVQISKEPLFTIGQDAFLTDLLLSGGGRSVTESVSTAFPKLSKETASALNPEVIILSDSPDNQEPNDAFRNSPAVKNGRVYKINADILSRPGPRLVDALEQIAKFLHPEKFKPAAEPQD